MLKNGIISRYAERLIIFDLEAYRRIFRDTGNTGMMKR